MQHVNSCHWLNNQHRLLPASYLHTSIVLCITVWEITSLPRVVSLSMSTTTASFILRPETLSLTPPHLLVTEHTTHCPLWPSPADTVTARHHCSLRTQGMLSSRFLPSASREDSPSPPRLALGKWFFSLRALWRPAEPTVKVAYRTRLVESR